MAIHMICDPLLWQAALYKVHGALRAAGVYSIQHAENEKMITKRDDYKRFTADQSHGRSLQ